MKTVIGLLLLVACFLGTIFFRHYTGTIISHSTVWYLFFIALGILGAWLIYSTTRKDLKIAEQRISSETENLKANAEKIELDFDKCEFKSGSYSHQVDNPNMSAVKLFAPGSLASIETSINETVIQSYLIYTETINDKVYKFISQSFPFDQTTLKFYVLNHSISLYVDRFKRERYLFDLKR